MKLLIASIVIAIAALSSCRTDRSGDAEATCDPSVSGEEVAPLDLYASSAYASLVRRVFLGDGDPWSSPDYWMVVSPSFSSERFVALAPPVHDDSESKVADAPWNLTVATASISASARGADGTHPDWSLLSPSAFVADRVEIPIAAVGAHEIAACWRAIVRRARHPAPDYVFLENGERVEQHTVRFDGTSYEFRADQYCGRTWSPDAGPAADLVALLGRLSKAPEVVGSDVRARDAMVRACAAAARDIRERVEALPW